MDHSYTSISLTSKVVVFWLRSMMLDCSGWMLGLPKMSWFFSSFSCGKDSSLTMSSITFARFRTTNITAMMITAVTSTPPTATPMISGSLLGSSLADGCSIQFGVDTTVVTGAMFAAMMELKDPSLIWLLRRVYMAVSELGFETGVLLETVLLEAIVSASICAVTQREPVQTPTTLTREVSVIWSMAQMLLMKFVRTLLAKNSSMFMAKCVVRVMESTRERTAVQSRASVRTNWMVLLLQKQMLLPHWEVLSSASRLEALLRLVSSSGFTTTLLTVSLIEFGSGQQSFTMMQLELLPASVRVCSCSCRLCGGTAEKVMLQVLKSETSETKRPKRWFCGSFPSHSHSRHPFVTVVQLLPSQVRFTGHITRVLKSAAIDWYSSAAKSVRLHLCPFIAALKTQPGSLSPITLLLAMTVPTPPRKPPVQSVIWQFCLPVQSRSPHPPNHPSWLSSGASHFTQLLPSQPVQLQPVRQVPPTMSNPPVCGRKTKLLLHTGPTAAPLQFCLKLSKTTLVRQALLSKTGCLQTTSKPAPNLPGIISPLLEAVNSRTPMLLTQPVAELPQQQRQLGRETGVMNEFEKKAVWLVLPSEAPILSVAPRPLSARTKCSRTMDLEEGGPMICPMPQAQALMYEKPWHSWSILLKMKPMLAEPMVLLAKGLISSSSQPMCGTAHPWPTEPWHTLSVTRTLCVRAFTQKSEEKQAISSCPASMVGRAEIPTIRLLAKVKSCMASACTPNTHALQRTFLVRETLCALSTLMQKALQLAKEEELTREVKLPPMRLRKTSGELVESSCPPSTNCTPTSCALPTRRTSAVSVYPYTTTLKPHPASAPALIRMFRLRWPTRARASRSPCPEETVTFWSPQCVQRSGAVRVIDPSTALMLSIVPVSNSEQRLKEGASEIESPTAQSVLSPTLMTRSPLKAVSVSVVITLAGGFPKRLSEPETTSILLPVRRGSMVRAVSVFWPLSWMLSLCVKGLPAEPAVKLPARMKMKLATMVTSRESSAMRLPSMVRLLIGRGSMSSTRRHSPLTVTLSPARGTTPPGHWVALLQYLRKSSSTKVPGGSGQTISQTTPVTSVYSKSVLFFALWQSVNMRELLLSLLSWKYWPFWQEEASSRAGLGAKQLAFTSGLPPTTGPTRQSSRFSLQLNLKMMPLSSGTKEGEEKALRCWKSTPLAHQMLQVLPVMQGSDQLQGLSFDSMIVLASRAETDVYCEAFSCSGTVSFTFASSVAFIICDAKSWCLSRFVKATRRTVTLGSHITASSHSAELAGGGQTVGFESAMCGKPCTMVAEALLARLSQALLSEPSVSQMTSRLRPIMLSSPPVTLTSEMRLRTTSVPRLVYLSGSSQRRQVWKRMLPGGKLQKLTLVSRVTPERPVIAPDMPSVQLVGSAAALVRERPTMKESMTVGGSRVKLARQNSTPLWQLSPMEKFWKTVLPVCSASSPSSMFLQSTKFEKSEVEAGFANQGSVPLLSSRTASQGNRRDCSLKMRSPKRTLEWATLSWTLPSGFPMGQTSLVAEGPSGLVLISYQMPQKSLPAARLPQKWLVGLVTQKEATEVSVASMLLATSEPMARLLRMVLWVSMPSSTKKLCPRTLYPTFSSTVRQNTACRVTTRASESCTAFPRTQEVGTSPFMWKWMQQRPRIAGCPHCVNSAQATRPSAPFTDCPAIIRCEPYCFTIVVASSPRILMFRVSSPTSATIGSWPEPQVSMEAACAWRKEALRVSVRPLTAVMVLRSASQWQKLVEATTISSPACQSTSSASVSVEAPGAMGAASVVQVGVRGRPQIDSAHSMHPMPLLPNIGCCTSQQSPCRMKSSRCWCGASSVPAMNRPPTTVMKPAFTVRSRSSEKMSVALVAAIPRRLGVSWSTRSVMPAGTATKSPSMGGRSTPQVRLSLHRSTQQKVARRMAALAPIRTSSELLAGMLGRAPTVQVIVVEFITVALPQVTPSMTTEGVSKSRLLPVSVSVQPPKVSPQRGEKAVTMAVLAAAQVALAGKGTELSPSSQMTSEGFEARSAMEALLQTLPQSWISAMLHCEAEVCANRTYLKDPEEPLTSVFHPLCTVWSTVDSVLQEARSLEPWNCPSRILLAVFTQLRLGKKRKRLTEALRPSPKSMPTQQAALVEAQKVEMEPSKEAAAVEPLVTSLKKVAEARSSSAGLASEQVVCVSGVSSGGSWYVTELEFKSYLTTRPTRLFTRMLLTGERPTAEMVKSPPLQEQLWAVVTTLVGISTSSTSLTTQKQLTPRTRKPKAPVVSGTWKETTVPLTVQLLTEMLCSADRFETSTIEAMGSVEALVMLRETVLRPGGTVALEASERAPEQEAQATQFAPLKLLTGPTKLMEKQVVSAAGGICTVMELPAQHETTLPGKRQLLLASLITTENWPSERSKGKPDPPVKVTSVPEVAPEVGVLDPALQRTLRGRELLSPNSLRTLTLYFPETSVAGMEKVAAVAEQAEAATTVTALVIEWERLTLQLEPAVKTVPLRLTTLPLTVRLVREGLLAAERQEKLQEPTHSLSTISRVVTKIS